MKIRLVLAGLIVLVCSAVYAVNDDQPEPLLSYLQQREIKDPILRPVIDTVRRELASIIVRLRPELASVELFATEFDDDFPGLMGSARIPNCVAVTRGLPHPSILCNASFLRDMEVAVRLFEGGLLTVQENTLLSVLRVKDPDRLRSLRENSQLAARSNQSSSHIKEHLKVALLFIAGHELGHLVRGQDFLAYTSAERSAATEREKLRSAVLRTCRHAKDFSRLKFDLPGFDPLITNPESEVLKIEANYREAAVEAWRAEEQHYTEEIEADRFALRVLNQYLDDAGRLGGQRAMYEQYLLIETLSWLGLYKWFTELLQFADKYCGDDLFNSKLLAVCMTRQRETYVRASQVFGDTHRFTLLRAHEATTALIEARIEPELRALWPEKEKINSPDSKIKMSEIWRASIMQIHLLVALLMDTPVKLSYVACSTGWFMELDRKRRAPQQLLMTFETLEEARERMRRFR